MDQEIQHPKPISVLESLGEEIIRIIAPVSICMFLVVLLVTVLNTSPSSSPSNIATMAYSEETSDTDWDKFKGALLNSLVFVAVVTVVTFILVALFYFRCTKFLKLYMGFSTFVVLGFLGAEVCLFLISDYGIPVDCITFLIVLFNFSVVGVVSIYLTKMAIFVTQSYLVVIGMLVAYWFTMLPEWTTWALLIAMALYDLAAVLLPGGPLRILVELAMSRDEEIPALVYEARPVTYSTNGVGEGNDVRRRLWKERSDFGTNPDENSNSNSSIGDQMNETRLVIAEDDQFMGGSLGNSNVSELVAPLINHQFERPESLSEGRDGEANLRESGQIEGIGLGSTGAIKLGLGDFIFYSVLVGRAAMYDFMTVYACYLAIIAGLGITLMLLAFYRKALPALPVSILLGVLFYFLTRILLEAFVSQCSFNLVMF